MWGAAADGHVSAAGAIGAVERLDAASPLASRRGTLLPRRARRAVEQPAHSDDHRCGHDDGAAVVVEPVDATVVVGVVAVSDGDEWAGVDDDRGGHEPNSSPDRLVALRQGAVTGRCDTCEREPVPSGDLGVGRGGEGFGELGDDGIDPDAATGGLGLDAAKRARVKTDSHGHGASVARPLPTGCRPRSPQVDAVVVVEGRRL